jgi:hypothetical protein
VGRKQNPTLMDRTKAPILRMAKNNRCKFRRTPNSEIFECFSEEMMASTHQSKVGIDAWIQRQNNTLIPFMVFV